MTDRAAPQEPIEVTADGVTVRKARVTDEFPVPTVRFEITSERDEPATVTIAERIPDGFSMDAVGFHQEYESDGWTAYQNRRIEFQREVDPGETVLTLYGVRTDDAGDIEQFMGPPRVTVSAGSTAPTPGSDDAGEDPAPDPAGEPGTEEGAPADRSDRRPVAERLADELREDRIDETTRTAIREELGLDLSAATEAQLRHLQTRVEDAIAYAETVEAFLEADAPDRMETLSEEVDAIRATVEDLEAEVSDLDAAVSELDGLPAAGEGADVDGDPEAIHTQLEGMRADLDELETAVTELQDWREQLMETFGGRE